MSKKQIMLACAAGMSTSLLVTKMEKAADNRGLQADIFALPLTEAGDYALSHPVDVVLLGPQVAYQLSAFQESLAEKDIPVAVVPMVDYGMMNGDKVIALAESLMK
ncbi:TPA: PTS sugar transporter subunit IIB [Streptococcus equi subsp. zooepidemicus]|uniref:PTS sugar transporter subunit IIB n=1 Tax=Streptococcus equi TaxID=1336 RepID=UPI001E498D85|nr:PTS sugar transporter subunit IIB [Streptococcus equi]MCD3458498.1 PTS sugar transporter subunit IIB [Streptococcus equi subsp. zooepidemicus]MDI5902798.1 PTS sugar transporter subunit IIB [Streptococcus equi subsp. zooepidemicus]MDI5931511.1 PTS sugar transporter subunit IIB [Streptococcus equi subsp. zooepidemicus]MDI6030515.1 PTS sugar transporter subunit IIB [Streptococcus equi subsp. zooepidemicus]HEL0593743.1 PTS sugar transporter subunit IIB [Streptococcus equi subsp. zooepidemicus]